MSDATKFCSRCGYLLTGTAELLSKGGALSGETFDGGTSSARSRGVKQGLFLILLAIVLVPILGLLLRFAIGMPNPWPMGVILFLLGGGGFLRVAYALMFEEGGKSGLKLDASSGAPVLRVEGLSDTAAQSALPPQQTSPATDYTAPSSRRWLDTNDLQPTSVTENTTRHLEKDVD